MIHIQGDKFELAYSEYAIDKVITNTAKVLCGQLETHADDIVFLVMMNGATWFANKLFGEFPHLRSNVEYLSVSSHGGDLKFDIKPKKEYIKNKHVFVIDDIINSGKTMVDAYGWLRKEGAASISICPLCVREKVTDMGIYNNVINKPLVIDDDACVVGCGMDYHNRGRDLREIYSKI